MSILVWMFRKRMRLLLPLIVFLIMGLTVDFTQAQDTAIAPTISMDFQDADLKDVLKVFSQQANLNFIASENVKDRKVTLYLDQVSVQDALDTIITANNLAYEQKPDSRIFIVKEWGKPDVETVTKIFPLQYARVKGYELTAAAEAKGASKNIGIREVIEKLLTKHGSVIEDSRTNSLVVTDVPSQFERIEPAIAELDVKLSQVMIEAEIVEASLETIDKLGIQWGNADSGALLSSAGASRITTWPFVNQGEGVSVALPSSTLYTGYINASNLGGTLALLVKDTDAKILARPKIMTLNNETAEIKIIADTAIASQEVTTSVGEQVSSAVTSFERTETGVTLKVTPQINKSGEITMVIEPSVTNVKPSTLFSALNPNTRTVKTTVNIMDGQTLIIGGLINTEDEKIFRKVPFLGDIPFLGNAFRKKDDTTTDKELVIFITPHLIKDSEEVASLPSPDYGFDVQSGPDSFEIKESVMDDVLDSFEGR